MEAFSIMLRIIRMYMVKGVKILLIALILALLDFFLGITLQNFSSIVPVSVIIESAWLYSMHFFVSGICTPFPPFQSFLLPAELLWDFPSQQITPILNLEGKGESATGVIVFSGWEVGRGRAELLAAAEEAGWADPWVGDKLTGVRQSRTPSSRPTSLLWPFPLTSSIFPGNVRCSWVHHITAIRGEAKNVRVSWVLFSAELWNLRVKDHMRSVKNLPMTQSISVPADICQMTPRTESHVCSVHELLCGYL